MESYSQLSRAQLSFDYLHTNSTTHEFLFGAIAELIDNSRDAGATELDIFTIKDPLLRGGFMLYFVDNGCGMTSDEARNVIIFGKSFKRSADGTSIGMYGNGLKSGSMRIGSDMIIFTKREGVCTCLFLSRTFHENEKLDEVIVPLPTFRSEDKSPIFITPDEQKKHELEMQIILKYSPFRCIKDFFSQFDKLKGENGTLVIIYNMKLLDTGSAELDTITDPRDIILTASSDKDDPMEPHADIELPPEKRSLRAYVSILYADPRMKVYIQGRKVQTKRLLDTLYAAKRYNYASKTFRMRAERDLAKAKNDVKVAELRAKEAESKARDCELRYEDSKDPEHLKMVRRLSNSAAELRNMVAIRQNTVARKQKALKDPKTLTFYFGMNVVNRACDGMFVYNCSRLIKMYQRIGPQQDSSMMCRGVVGIVDVPYMVLEPTHNKQDFADAKEYRQLMRAMADHLMQYWDDLAIDKHGSEDTNRFWKSFGYLSARWRDPPSNEEKYTRKRYSCVSTCVQCDKCLRWRVLPYSQNQIGRDVPDSWQCRDNPDQKHRRCDSLEEDMSPPMGVLKRKIKSKEQRQAELEEQIRKKQEELEQIIDPDDEIISKRGKRSSQGASPTSVPPAKKNANTLPIVSTASLNSRAMTVADKRRMSSSTTSSLKSSRISNLPLPNNVSKPRSGALVPAKATPSPSVKGGRSSSSRRLVRELSSEEDEEDDDDDDDDDDEEDEEDIVEKVYEKMASKKSNNQKAVQEHSALSEKSSVIVTKPREVEFATFKNSKLSEGKQQDSADTVTASTNGTPTTGGAKPLETVSEKLRSTKTNSAASMDSFAESVTVKNGNMEKVLEKFKVCLRYFLPPQWPMQKDRIHTLTETELADFPLEDFFDRYEQGLRALLSTFQQETQVFSENLTTLRKDVISLLDKTAPELKANTMEGESIDQLLREYLAKNA